MTSIKVFDYELVVGHINHSLRNTSIIFGTKENMLKIKKGVNVAGIRPEMTLAIIAATSFCSDIKKNCTITSALEGQHSTTSLHYIGCAVDFRTRNMNKAEKEMFRNSMTDALSNDFDVVLEHNHLHVEYQPKR